MNSVFGIFIFSGSAWAEPIDPGSLIHQALKTTNGPEACVTDSDPEYCKDMSKLACRTPGTFNDGTGTVYSEEDSKARLDPIREKMKKDFQKDILNALKNKDPKLDLIRQLAKQATLQTDSPDCAQDLVKQNRDACYLRISSMLSERLSAGLFANGMGPMRMMTNAGVDFESLKDLTSNATFSSLIEPSFKKGIKLLVDEKADRKVDKEVFPRVKKLIIQKITETVKSPVQQQALIRKINNISYGGSTCGGIGSKSGVRPYLVENAYYDPNAQEFHFCNGFLIKNNSEFAMAMVISHELTHSIDPCSIDKPKGAAAIQYQYKEIKTVEAAEAQNPFSGVISCLRSVESVGANRVKYNYSKESGIEPVLMENPFCGGADQIGEGFSDWMASEILPQYIEQYHSNLSTNQKAIGVSNTFRNLCSNMAINGFQPNEPSWDVHSKSEDRLNRIIMANPDTRSMIGCKVPVTEPHHCNNYDGFKGNRVPDKIEEMKTFNGGMYLSPKSSGDQAK